MWFATFFFIFIEKIKARKKLFIQNEGTISGRRKTELSKTIIVLTEILTGTHFWELALHIKNHLTNQKKKKCVCVLLSYTPYWKRNMIAKTPHKEVDWNAILFLWDTRYINHWSCILPPASFRIKWECTLLHKRDTWK